MEPSLWLPISALVFLRALTGPTTGAVRGCWARRPATGKGYRTRVSCRHGAIALLLVSLPFVPAVAGVGGSSIHYSYQPRFTSEVGRSVLATRRGPVKLFTWRDPQNPYPTDALRVRSADVGGSLPAPLRVD